MLVTDLKVFIFLSLDKEKLKRDQGFYKLNTSRLLDNNYNQSGYRG